MQVFIPSPLRSYTNEARYVDADGSTLGALLLDLDRRYPGIRFRMIDEQDRIRQHIRIFINAREATRLQESLQPQDEVHLICALSGG